MAVNGTASMACRAGRPSSSLRCAALRLPAGRRPPARPCTPPETPASRPQRRGRAHRTLPPHRRPCRGGLAPQARGGLHVGQQEGHDADGQSRRARRGIVGRDHPAATLAQARGAEHPPTGRFLRRSTMPRSAVSKRNRAWRWGYRRRWPGSGGVRQSALTVATTLAYHGSCSSGRGCGGAAAEADSLERVEECRGGESNPADPAENLRNSAPRPGKKGRRGA